MGQLKQIESLKVYILPARIVILVCINSSLIDIFKQFARASDDVQSLSPLTTHSTIILSSSPFTFLCSLFTIKRVLNAKPITAKQTTMKMTNQTTSCILLLAFLALAMAAKIEAQSCKPSGYITGITPPPGQCNQGEESDCCKAGKHYTTYKCSPPVTGRTKATLTWNSFEKGGSGGGPSECDNKYHPDDHPVVALSTGWFNNKSRCLNFINIHGNGKTVRAMVVDECDSTMGCDSDHDYQPPCPDNIVDASKAVWKALGVPEDNWGDLDITWSDA